MIKNSTFLNCKMEVNSRLIAVNFEKSDVNLYGIFKYSFKLMDGSWWEDGASYLRLSCEDDDERSDCGSDTMLSELRR